MRQHCQLMVDERCKRISWSEPRWLSVAIVVWYSKGRLLVRWLVRSVRRRSFLRLRDWRFVTRLLWFSLSCSTTLTSLLRSSSIARSSVVYVSHTLHCRVATNLVLVLWPRVACFKVLTVPIWQTCLPSRFGGILPLSRCVPMITIGDVMIVCRPMFQLC